ncbi:trp operon repressor [Psychromonas ossibalaenae]|uniref:trp operon repressor n=1 Tax=Psychromonas ossibalaenae TaxID=444922 RepID=UPI000360A06B|nr:trp operon repressor [Psychromonas ossibalaenae]
MIAKLLSETVGSEDLTLLIPLLLSPEELNAVNGRILVYKELLLGEKPQREIAKEYKISIATITRGSNNLKSMSSAERKLLQKLLIKE